MIPDPEKRGPVSELVNPEKEPLAHIIRPVLPWRVSADTTECGRRIVDVATAVPLPEAQAIWKRHGKQRAAFLLCSTCVSTANRYGHDYMKDDIAKVLQREINWQGNERLNAELRALGLLVEAHRDEFDAAVSGLGSIVPMDDLRRARRDREAQ